MIYKLKVNYVFVFQNQPPSDCDVEIETPSTVAR